MLIISLLIVLALTGADQLIKYLIVANFDECAGHLKKYYTFSIGDFDVFSITHIRNRVLSHKAAPFSVIQPCRRF